MTQITTKSNLEIRDSNGEMLDIKHFKGRLQVMSKKGKWIKARNLQDLTNPIQFRIVIDK